MLCQADCSVAELISPACVNNNEQHDGFMLQKAQDITQM